MSGPNAGALIELLNDHVTRRAVDFVYGLSDAPLPYIQNRMGIDPVATLPDRLLDMRPGRRRTGKRG